eukprot:gene14002-15460_t
MGQKKKKGESGTVTNYISRSQALKKLQLSLPDFRRLCILKGIYPREPKHKKKLNKGNNANKTYYFIKDIQYLAHEPVLNKFREFKIFMRKLKRALGRDELETAERLKDNKPVYTLDHIVKERYPLFEDALKDLDDALSMIFLFAVMPQTDKITGDVVMMCKRMGVEFQNYVIASRSLRKVFISIKGIYYQAEIQGCEITWLVPHRFNLEPTIDVDFRVMLTFVEFYTTLIGFVNFHLYNLMNLKYPPQVAVSRSEESKKLVYCDEIEIKDEKLAALNQTLVTMTNGEEEVADIDEFTAESGNLEAELQERRKKEEEQLNSLKSLFKGLKIFISREVPREPLVFTIRCFGGDVSWDEIVGLGSTFGEDDETITHQIIDRPLTKQTIISRHYLQPQWIFDCVNLKRIIPIDEYLPGCPLPPHLSPFVEEDSEDYVPPERQAIIEEEKDLLKEERSSDVREEKSKKEAGKASTDELSREEKNLAVMMMSGKKRKLYERIMHGKKKKAAEGKGKQKASHVSETETERNIVILKQRYLRRSKAVKMHEWNSIEQRQKLVQEIDLALSQSGNPTMRSGLEIEEQIFQRARNKEEYFNLSARFILHLKEVTATPNNMSNVTPSQKGIFPQVFSMKSAQPDRDLISGYDGQDKTSLQQMQPQTQTQNSLLKAQNALTLQQQQQQIIQNASGTSQVAPNAIISGVQNFPNQLINSAAIQSNAPNSLTGQSSGTFAQRKLQANEMTSATTLQHLKQRQQMGFQNAQVAAQRTQTQQSTNQILSQQQIRKQQVSQQQQQQISLRGISSQSPIGNQVSPCPPSNNPPSIGPPAQSPLGAADEVAYAEKLKELVKYVEPLGALINKMSKGEEHAAKRNKLMNIYEVFTNKRRVTPAFLSKCEQVVQALLSVATPPPQPNPGSAYNVKQNALLTVTENLVPLASNAMLLPAADHCIDPVLKCVSAATIRHPKPPRSKKRPRPSSAMDENSNSPFPYALQLEIAHLCTRFLFQIDEGLAERNQCPTFHCKPKISDMPSPPSIILRVPENYPNQSPDYTIPMQDDSVLAQTVKSKFKHKLLKHELEQFQSITCILEAWDESIRESKNSATLER